MAYVSRRDLVLLLVGLDPKDGLDDEVGGITRLQKYLFLLEQEGGVTPTKEGFEFEAYKAGPYSSKLYDDLEFLENLGLLETEVAAEATAPEAAEVDVLTFGELMGDDGDDENGARTADAYEEHQFRLTERGKVKIEKLLSEGDYTPVVEGIRRVKSKYGKHSLSDLLYHVYTKFPDMATESEIKDQVLRRGRRK